MKISPEYLTWNPPTTYCSASVLVAGAECLRRGIINGYFNPGGGTIHTEFGSALGNAAGAIAEFWEEGYDIYMGKALEACLAFPVTYSEGNKNWRSLWRAVLMFATLWEHQYSIGWRFETAEAARRLDITDDSGFQYHLAGAQDLTLRNVHTQHKKVVDLKAVKTSYYYSWNYDIQVLVYNILDDLATPDPQIYERPEFWVYETEGSVESTDQFTVHVLEGSVIKGLLRSLPRLAKQLCKEAEKLRGFGVGADSIVRIEDYFDTIPANHKACKSGNFRCFQYDICHGDLPVRPGGRTVYATPQVFTQTETETVVTIDSLVDRIVDGYEAGGIADPLNIGYGIEMPDATLPADFLTTALPHRTTKLFE